MSTNSQRGVIWDPRITLEIVPDNRCVGHAPSKNRKCLNPIAFPNMSSADAILQDLSERQPDADCLRATLRRLAIFTLCRRYHQPQADEMVEKWMVRIRRSYPLGRVQRARRSVSPPVSISRITPVASPVVSPVASPVASQNLSRTPESRTVSRASSVTVSAQSPREKLLDTIRDLQEKLHLAQLDLVAMDRPRTPSPPRMPSTRNRSITVFRVDTTEIPSFDLSHIPTAASTLIDGARSPRTQTPTTPPRRSTAASSSTPCPRRHVRRRAIEPECPLCREDIEPEHPLVWCKESCGQSVHKTCFDAWKEQCQRSHRRLDCGICRAIWISECECGDEIDARSS